MDESSDCSREIPSRLSGLAIALDINAGASGSEGVELYMMSYNQLSLVLQRGMLALRTS